MSLFNHSNLAFQPVDPLDDGLADDIAAEQNESEHIELSEQLDASLADKWGEILTDLHKDPSFFSFAEDDE